MLSRHGRRPASRLIEPIARSFMKMGLSANVVTIGGTCLACLGALILIPTGHFFAAAVVIGLLTATDLVDGTMARLNGGGTVFGATLDASCDRITDGILFAAMVWWIVTQSGPGQQLLAALIVLVTSQVVSYVKARAEAGGIPVSGGLIERPERLIISLAGLGLEGLGVPHALSVALWVLAVGSIITILQRLHMTGHSPQAREFINAPDGVPDSQLGGGPVGGK